MRRRRLIAAAGLAALAGCSESSDGEGTDAPEASPTGDGNDAAGGDDATTTAAAGAERPLTGLSLSPRSYGGDDFRAFFERAAEAGSLVRWAGDWAELGREDGPPAAVATLARRYGMVPMVETGVFSAGARELFRPLTPETRANYVEWAASFCEAHAPPYLGVGVEVDFHHRTDPDSFETFVDLFAETHAAVKAVSPDTLVYTGFQLEQLRGLRGGLFGGETDPGSADWALLDRFPDADLTAVTSYPGLIYGDPDEVPGDYYAALADHTDRPIAVTETGWSVETKGQGWESDEAEQADFVERLFALTAGLDVEALLWVWLHEQADETGAFSGTSLLRDDGSERPAWEAWVEGP